MTMAEGAQCFLINFQCHLKLFVLTFWLFATADEMRSNQICFSFIRQSLSLELDLAPCRAGTDRRFEGMASRWRRAPYF